MKPARVFVSSPVPVNVARRRWGRALMGVTCLGLSWPVWASMGGAAPGIDVHRLDVTRQDGALLLSVAVRPGRAAWYDGER